MVKKIGKEQVMEEMHRLIKKLADEPLDSKKNWPAGTAMPSAMAAAWDKAEPLVSLGSNQLKNLADGASKRHEQSKQKRETDIPLIKEKAKSLWGSNIEEVLSAKKKAQRLKLLSRLEVATQIHHDGFSSWKPSSIVNEIKGVREIELQKRGVSVRSPNCRYLD